MLGNITSGTSEIQNLFGNSVMMPYEEIIAYETLWTEQGSSYKKIAKVLSQRNVLPSDVLKEKYGFFPPAEIENVKAYINSKIGSFSMMLKENVQYPKKLLDAKYPIDFFYYKGDVSLLETRSISVVGARNCSVAAKHRTHKLTKLLVDKGFTIVSGLAEGVDTIALKSAMWHKGNVVAVIGTPIDMCYPKKNKGLQDEIAKEYLLISQVPFYKYEKQPFNTKKTYFPERNATMSAISEATVIVEASDTSGSLTQARAAIEQGRKLFILDSCFKNKSITWPERFEKKGAIRVKSLDDILEVLGGIH